MPSPVNVVIPTKSNFTGLAELLSDLSLDPAIGTICIVADGQAAFDALPDPPEHILTITVPKVSAFNTCGTVALRLLVAMRTSHSSTTMFA
jgi:hypothetical protein